MEDGRSVQIDAAFSISYPVVGIMDIRQNVRVRQHHALRSASRAAGVDHCQNRFRVVTDFRSVIIWFRQWFFVNHQLPPGMTTRRSQRGMPHQPERGCVGEYVINLHDRQSCIDRDDDDT